MFEMNFIKSPRGHLIRCEPQSGLFRSLSRVESEHVDFSSFMPLGISWHEKKKKETAWRISNGIAAQIISKNGVESRDFIDEVNLIPSACNIEPII